MAELVLLSFDRVEVIKLNNAARAGDETALNFFKNLWADYRDSGLCCFLCDHEICEIEYPPFAQVIGDLADPSKAIGAPLCARCRDLPQMVRWNRCMKMMRAMHQALTGKNVHYQYAPVQRHVPGRR